MPIEKEDSLINIYTDLQGRGGWKAISLGQVEWARKGSKPSSVTQLIPGPGSAVVAWRPRTVNNWGRLRLVSSGNTEQSVAPMINAGQTYHFSCPSHGRLIIYLRHTQKSIDTCFMPQRLYRLQSIHSTLKLIKDIKLYL